jgi:starvation-inducible DNA-binding protein
MFKSPNQLPEKARATVIDALNASLADGLDLQGQVKVAHWNVKGPHFKTVHELLDEVAGIVTGFNDELAERAVILGGRAYGTARHVVKTSRLPDYPQDTTRDLEHVRLVAERVEKHLEGLRAVRGVADDIGDDDTSDLVTAQIEELEKQGWFLRATLEA